MNTLTLKTKLTFSSPADKAAVIQILEAQRTCFNFCSQYKFMNRNCTEKVLHDNTYYELRKLYPEFKSQIIIKGRQAVMSAFRSIKSNKQKIDKPPVKKKLSSLFDRNLCLYRNGSFRLSTFTDRVIAKPVLYPKLSYYLSTYKFGNILLFVKNNNIYICLYFKIQDILPKEGLVLGIDLGIRRFAATSEGNIYQDKEFLKRKRKLRYLKRVLNSKKKNSHSARMKLKKLRNKESNSTKNFCHHLVNQVLKTECTKIVLEDLNLIKMKSKKHKYENKNKISQVPFSILKHIFTYKATLLQKEVICVYPAYTSLTDHSTGEVMSKDRRKGCRFYGTHKIFDADVNAAINIAKRSKLPISCCEALDGQAVINQPIVS